MRQVLVWFKWKADWWEPTQAVQRHEGEVEILQGGAAYARKQADVMCRLAKRCAAAWLPELKKWGITPDWAGRYMVSDLQDQETDDVITEVVDDDIEEMVLDKDNDEGDEFEFED